MNKYRGMKVYILDHGSRWRWMVKFTPSAWTPGQSELSAPQSRSAHTLMKRREKRYVPAGNGTSVARTITGHHPDWAGEMRNATRFFFFLRKTDEPSGQFSSGFIDNAKNGCQRSDVKIWSEFVTVASSYQHGTTDLVKCSRDHLGCIALQSQQRLFTKWADIWTSLDQILIVIVSSNWKIFEQLLQINFVWKQS